MATGLDTEVLKRTGKADKAECYLSLVTTDRSLDLCFDTAQERNLWASALADLVRIEVDVRTSSRAVGAPPSAPLPAPVVPDGLND